MFFQALTIAQPVQMTAISSNKKGLIIHLST
jgi:hypothetical protein